MTTASHTTDGESKEFSTDYRLVFHTASDLRAVERDSVLSAGDLWGQR